MKRTPFKRKIKSIPAHEKAHYKLIASLPCAECGIDGWSQCAHSNLAIHGKGLGIKANYLYTFPLCCTRPDNIGCHVKLDQLIGMTKEESIEKTMLYLLETNKKLL